MPSKNHVHRYAKRELSTYKVFACTLSDCSHYQPRHMESMLEGRRSLCTSCGEEFILNRDSMKEDEPRCDDCRFESKTEVVIPVSDVILGYIEKKG